MAIAAASLHPTPWLGPHHVVQPGQFDLQNIPAEKQERLQGLVLR
jgi:hypothetical protein